MTPNAYPLASPHICTYASSHASSSLAVSNPRIGKYAVSASLRNIWTTCAAAHTEVKHTPLAQRFRTRTLTVAQFSQFLCDRRYIFDCLESLLSSCRGNGDAIVAVALRDRLARKEAVDASMPIQMCLNMKPSDAAMALVEEMVRKKTECEVKEFDEFLEWHSFILYCELWFGGTVHAKAIELMIRDGVDVWRDVYQDDVTKATSLWRYGDDSKGRVESRSALANEYFLRLSQRIDRMNDSERQSARAMAVRAMEWHIELMSLGEYTL